MLWAPRSCYNLPYGAALVGITHQRMRLIPVDLTVVGISYLSWMNCELFLSKYTKNSPIEDVVKALCRESYIVSSNPHEVYDSLSKIRCR